MSMRFETLAQWLNWQESLHPSLIDLGLERVSAVFQCLYPDSTAPFTVITVAGTNGKGSSVALLESILLAAGYRVGTYTSPHLLRYNERICINGEQAPDAAITDSFQRIDIAREDISLTYFEFGTLAALDIFYQTPLDVVLLEVGLGGRLDAVNIIDSDVVLITSIGIDHTDWLGSDRESIAKEKAGIMRTGKPVVCSDADIPQAIPLPQSWCLPLSIVWDRILPMSLGAAVELEEPGQTQSGLAFACHARSTSTEQCCRGSDGA